MPKSIMTAAFAALMAATAPIAYAQTTTAPATTPAPRASTPPADNAVRDNNAGDRTAARNDNGNRDTFTTDEGQLRAAQIIGSTVYDKQNENVGSVKDVLLDRGGRVKSVVLDVGAFLGMGGKYVTVSLNDIKTDNNRLTLDQTKDQLKSAPEFHFRTR